MRFFNFMFRLTLISGLPLTVLHDGPSPPASGPPWIALVPLERCPLLPGDPFGYRCKVSRLCVQEELLCNEESDCSLQGIDDDDTDESQELCGPRGESECDDVTCSDGSCAKTLAYCPGVPHFTCGDGTKILLNQTCDRTKDCLDGSDENAGCKLFFDEGCFSWYGLKHVRCNDSEKICTLPKYQGNCRACDHVGHWRCDDGFCIKATSVKHGQKDCPDGSDDFEESSGWTTATNISVIVFSIAFILLVAIVCLMQKMGITLWPQTNSSAEYVPADALAERKGDVPMVEIRRPIV